MTPSAVAVPPPVEAKANIAEPPATKEVSTPPTAVATQAQPPPSATVEVAASLLKKKKMNEAVASVHVLEMAIAPASVEELQTDGMEERVMRGLAKNWRFRKKRSTRALLPANVDAAGTARNSETRIDGEATSSRAPSRYLS
ncbi:unnamed protein product [Linum trigynum]